MAADARVAISPIQTGGLPLKWHFSRNEPPTLTSRSWQQTWGYSDTRALAEQTGGIASFYAPATKPLDRLNGATRFHYLLGYSPSSGAWDGKYRRITVQVNRPGVTVLYRHGYYAQQELVPYDRRRFMTYARMSAAGADSRVIQDLSVTISASVTRRDKTDADVQVELRIDLSRVRFTTREGLYTGALDVAVFVGDEGEKLLGEKWESIDLKLDSSAHERLQREGIGYSVTVKASGRPKHVKVVVYDYDGDRLGTAAQQLQ